MVEANYHPLVFNKGSSNLRELKYNPVKEELAVIFQKSPKIYIYNGVDVITVTNLLDRVNKANQSLGVCFRELIIDADYSFDVIEPKDWVES